MRLAYLHRYHRPGDLVTMADDGKRYLIVSEFPDDNLNCFHGGRGVHKMLLWEMPE